MRADFRLATDCKGLSCVRSWLDMAPSDIRQYEARAASTDTFGRVLLNVRNHHFIIDGPEQNGCPGEEVTPGELFLSAVASCGVELVQVLAKSAGIPLAGISVKIQGTMDRSRPVRPDVSLFNSVHLQFRMKEVDENAARQLVEKFKAR
ncbi:MAG TPA: OsmC family protein [Candidatus Angelobacter sp.]|nr:OsmC family protein [Candidatus Angelobacter sp.]